MRDKLVSQRIARRWALGRTRALSFGAAMFFAFMSISGGARGTDAQALTNVTHLTTGARRLENLLDRRNGAGR